MDEDIELVRQSAREVWEDHFAELWLDSENSQLGFDTPRNLVNRGRVGTVLNFLEALKDGVIW